MYVKELDIFLTMKVLEDTPSSFYRTDSFAMNTDTPYEWINGQKPHLIEKGIWDKVQHRELRSDRGSWFINEFFLKLALFNIHDIFKAGN